ncbi:methyltransferase family protein [Williamsia limnetica]|uniref:Methyltransferase family protein n=2 Tax=Williamsia limnetica TaxID=882452 RepID=A0A318S7K2_WILLI|nr:methyltransferase family protein [Williamsia limnetica]
MGSRFDANFWDERYGSTDRVWSGKPTALLQSEVGALTAGDAVELGCGEGADAVWLARQGWQVDAVDFSAVALSRVAEFASHAGPEVAARIRTIEADLFDWEPREHHYDLVCAQYLHVPSELRSRLVRRASAAVRPGGHLLWIGHDRSDLQTGVARPGHPDLYFTAEEILACVDSTDWSVQTNRVIARDGVDRAGAPATVHDVVVRLNCHATRPGPVDGGELSPENR